MKESLVLEFGMEGKEFNLPLQDRIMVVDTRISLPASNASNLADIKVCEIYMGPKDGGKVISIYNYKNFTRTNLVEMVFYDGNNFRTADFPRDMMGKLSRYYSEDIQNKEKDFDCGYFAYFINGIEDKKISRDAGVYWNYSKLENEAELEAGSTVSLCEKKFLGLVSKSVHFAIYLGEGLYLSKFGTKGPLVVTDMENMKKAYKTDNVFLLKRKNSGQTT